MTGDVPPFTLCPPAPSTPTGRTLRHPVLAQVGAVVVFAGATFLALVAAVFLAVGLASSCGSPIDGDKTLLLKAGLSVVGALWVAVPGLIAHLSRRLHGGLAAAWAAVAAAAALFTMLVVVEAEASPFICF